MYPPPQDTSGRETQRTWRHTVQLRGLGPHLQKPPAQGCGRQSKETSFGVAAGGRQGALSHSALCLRRPGKAAPCKRIALATTVPPQQEKESFPLPLATAQPVRDCHNWANEKPPYSELPVCSNRLFVCNNLQNFPLSSIKQHCSPLFSRLAYGFAGSFFALQFLNKLPPLFFPGKITGSFIFKVTRRKQLQA